MSLQSNQTNNEKGSQREPFFTSACSIQQAHCWVELHRQKFFDNVRNIKQLIGPSVRIAAMLKANAYGHGLASLGQLCQESSGIDYLTVFLLSDAVALREQGIIKPILVLGSYDVRLTHAFARQIDVTVYDWHTAKEIRALSLELKQPVRVHLKCDTGLVRLGFLPDEMLAAVTFLKQSPFIELVGVFSHFALSDGAELVFTDQQACRFAEVIEQLRVAGVCVPLVHIANTAATLRVPQVHWTMIRCGGLLYGTYKKPDFYATAQQRVPSFTLSQICTIKARIMTIKDVTAGTPIGYGCSFVAPHMMRIAVVSIGYCDGYDRRLSNQGTMLVQGKPVSVIGRIGMNMTAIDVTSIAHVVAGDEVVVSSDVEGVRLRDIARTIDAIEYDIMAHINPLLPRKIV